MPIAATPALSQDVSDSSVESTPPVGMMRVQGIGPMTFFTKFGPPTSLPGNTFTISQPSAWALEISVALPQPGEYGIMRRLQSSATSGLSDGPTTKLAPQLMYIAPVYGSTIEPTPRISDGSAFAKWRSSSEKTCHAWSPRLTNSTSLQPPRLIAATTFLAVSKSA